MIYDCPNFDLSEAGAKDVQILKRHCTFSSFRVVRGSKVPRSKLLRKPQNRLSSSPSQWENFAVPTTRLLYALPCVETER
jgi:hypothetical protein